MSRQVNLRFAALVLYLAALMIGCLSIVIDRQEFSTLQAVIVVLANIFRLVDELRDQNSQ